MNQQQNNSTFWERALWLGWGATGTLFLTALAMELVTAHNAPRYETPLGWFLIWLILQGLLIFLGVVALLTKGWQQSNGQCVNRSFSFFACAWLLWPTLAIAFPNQDADIPYIVTIAIVIGGVLLGFYTRVKRKPMSTPA